MKPAIQPVWAPGALLGADGVAEAIAAKDFTNLYRTSCYFRDKERYRAFCAMYAVMRVVDDRVDDVLAAARSTPSATAHARDAVTAWHRAVRHCLSGGQPGSEQVRACDHPNVTELLFALSDAVERFCVPVWLWDDFFGAMLQDLKGRTFGTYTEFLAYADGAAVAPTTIYLYLIAAKRLEDGTAYAPPDDFEIVRCGRALGRFAYLAHILRDLRQDLMAGEHGLLYLASEDMAAHGVTPTSLRREARAQSSGPQARALVRELADRAATLASAGRGYLATLNGKLSVDRAFVLELIVRIYEAALRKIVSCSHDVMQERHRLTGDEKERIAIETATSQRLLGIEVIGGR